MKRKSSTTSTLDAWLKSALKSTPAHSPQRPHYDSEDATIATHEEPASAITEQSKNDNVHETPEFENTQELEILYSGSIFTGEETQEQQSEYEQQDDKDEEDDEDEDQRQEHEEDDGNLALQEWPNKEKTPSPNDLSKKGETIRQPNLKNFPGTVYSTPNPRRGKVSNRIRRMNASWYQRYNFVEYSVKNDALFCYHCRHFGNGKSLFMEYGYRDWKNVSVALKKHSESREHKDNVQKCSDWTFSQKRGNVQQLLDPEQVNDVCVERNKAHLLTMLDVAMFCAKQELPLRGSDESIDSSNKGNFLELFEMLKKYSPEVKKRFDALPANAKMIHHTIQNDLLEAAKEVILDTIKEEMSGEEYVILADEAKGLNKKENVAVATRYEKNGVIKERVIGFVEAEGLNATGISNSIISVVDKLELPPEKCVGLGFDGASVMSGETGGVQAILRTKYRNAIYVHCTSHRLNLVLNTICEAVKEVKEFFELLNELPTFMSGSKRHKVFLDVQKELGYEKVKELIHPSQTRWLLREVCSSCTDKVQRCFANTGATARGRWWRRENRYTRTTEQIGKQNIRVFVGVFWQAL